VYYLFWKKEKYTFSIGFTCCSVLFFSMTSIHNYWGHSGNSTTYSQSNIQILQGSAVILEETNYLAIGLWSLYAVVTLVLAIRFSVISSRFRLKWSQIQLIIRMPNWFWFPKNVTAHFPEYDFHQRNGIQQPWIEAELYTRTHACDSKTRWIFYSSNYWKPFFGSTLFFIFYKSHTTQEFLADEK
jgi:hypothetical protein